MATSIATTPRQATDSPGRRTTSRTAALIGVFAPLAAVLLSTLTAPTGDSQGCPPPSAHIQTAPTAAPAVDGCLAVDLAHTVDESSVPTATVIVEVAETPTGTTIELGN